MSSTLCNCYCAVCNAAITSKCDGEYDGSIGVWLCNKCIEKANRKCANCNDAHVSWVDSVDGWVLFCDGCNYPEWKCFCSESGGRTVRVKGD